MVANTCLRSIWLYEDQALINAVSTSFFGVQFYSSGVSVRTVIRYCHVILHFFLNELCLRRVSFRFWLSGSIIWGFCQWQSIFLCSSGIPNSAGPVCMFSNFTPGIFHISPTTNIKINHIWTEYDHILPFTNQEWTLLRSWFIHKA